MSDVNDERQHFLPFSEVATADLGEPLAVPVPAETGLWDAFTNKCVKLAHEENTVD